MNNLNTIEKFTIITLALMFAGFLSLAVVGQARGADGQNPRTEPNARAQSYHIDKQVAVYRSAVAVADTDDSSTWGSVAEYDLLGNPSIAISARFSGAASDTCIIKIAYYYEAPDGTLYYKGSSALTTLTASASLDANGDNEAPILGFDGRGSNMIKVIITSISAGNIDLWVGSH